MFRLIVPLKKSVLEDLKKKQKTIFNMKTPLKQKDINILTVYNNIFRT